MFKIIKILLNTFKVYSLNKFKYNKLFFLKLITFIFSLFNVLKLNWFSYNCHDNCCQKCKFIIKLAEIICHIKYYQSHQYKTVSYSNAD